MLAYGKLLNHLRCRFPILLLLTNNGFIPIVEVPHASELINDEYKRKAVADVIVKQIFRAVDFVHATVADGGIMTSGSVFKLRNSVQSESLLPFMDSKFGNFDSFQADHMLVLFGNEGFDIHDENESYKTDSSNSVIVMLTSAGHEWLMNEIESAGRKFNLPDISW